MEKLVRSKKVVALCWESLPIHALETALKLLYLINYPFIHPLFASFSLLVEVILWVFEGYPASIAT